MVFRFIMLSDENDLFRREYLIDSEATFLELNQHILDSVGYGSSELTSFYLCDDEWNKEQEVTLLDMGTGADYDSYLMEKTALEELLEQRGQRMLFVFDMLSERAFFLELAEIQPGKRLERPQTLRSQGDAPEQLSSIEFAETRSVGESLLDGIFDEREEVDLDDLDPEGFDGLDKVDPDVLY